MRFLHLLPLLAAATALAVVGPREEADAVKVDYTGFKGLRLALANPGQETEDKITELVAHVVNCSPGHGDTLDVVVDPANIPAVEALSISTSVLYEDVGAMLAAEDDATEEAKNVLLTRQTGAPPESWFTAYHTYAQHTSFLTQLQSAYPTNSRLFTAGTSVQGRALTGIHIYQGTPATKPAILFHGTVHAREWISTKTVEYMAWNLLTLNSAGNAAVRTLLSKFDFYIIPIVNPDGFAYTKSNDRLWRKNRQTVSGSTCLGRDQNRNWQYMWSRTGGASTNPCSETYKGLAAADTPEIQGLISHVNTLTSRGIRFYIDFHSYGQYVLWPFGYDCNFVAPSEARHQTLANVIRTGIAGVSGTAYTVGNSCRHLYATTGTAPDHLLGISNATYAYTIELRDRGTYGFVLPASQIQGTVRETWAGVLGALNQV